MDSKKKTKVVIYARVSTSTQDYDRQLMELREYASKMDYTVVKEVSEKISGAKKVEERQLADLITYAIAEKVDKILIYECSRLSRRVVDFLQIIENLTQNGISLYIHQNGLETLQPDGQPNPIVQLIMGMMAQFAAMERSLIRSRMSSGFQRYLEKGGRVGRKEGYKKSDEAMMEEYADVVRLLRKGYSLRNVAKIAGRSVNTVRKLKEILVKNC